MLSLLDSFERMRFSQNATCRFVDSRTCSFRNFSVCRFCTARSYFSERKIDSLDTNVEFLRVKRINRVRSIILFNNLYFIHISRTLHCTYMMYQALHVHKGLHNSSTTFTVNRLITLQSCYWEVFSGYLEY